LYLNFRVRDVWALLVFVLTALLAFPDFTLLELLLRAGVFFDVDSAAAAGFLPDAAFWVVFAVVLLFLSVLPLFAAGFFFGLAERFVVFFV